MRNMTRSQALLFFPSKSSDLKYSASDEREAQEGGDISHLWWIPDVVQQQLTHHCDAVIPRIKHSAPLIEMDGLRDQ